MKYTKNDEAVSPVIGVVLMVAITVILAAVIAAFVFGMVEMNVKKQIAVSASQTVDPSTGVYITTITYHGGQDFRDVSALEATITVPGGTPDNGFTWTYASMGTGPVPVGTAGTIALGTQHRDHVIVVATFFDGTEQLILDTFV